MSRSCWLTFIAAAAFAVVGPRWIAEKPIQPMDEGSEERGFLGVGVAYEEEDGRGRLRAHDVVAGGPSEKAGLRNGDLIVAVNGVPFRFKSAVEQYEGFAWVKPGDELELTVLRADSTLTLELTAGKTPANVTLQAAEILRQETVGRLQQTLLALGQGQGVVVSVGRDAETAALEFGAQDQRPGLFADMELYLGQFPPLPELIAKLEPGDSFKILFTSDGLRMDMKLLDLPPYLTVE